MNSLTKNTGGFTLIEILVAINLAFITLTLIISFYLFTERMIFSSIRKIETKYTLNQSLIKLNDVLKKSNYFQVKLQNDSTFIIFGSAKNIVFAKDQISLKNCLFISNITDYSLHISLQSGDELAVYNGVPQSGTRRNDNFIDSYEISSITLEFTKDGRIYRTSFDTPFISAKRFQNIE